MTKTILSILFISAILITGAIAASVSLLEDAEAAKAHGKTSGQYGKKTAGIVCGDRLCSEPAPAPAPEPEPAPEPAPVEEEEAEAAEQVAEEVTIEDEMSVDGEAIEEPKMEMKPHGWITATGTIQSMLDPGIGHETHQLAIILPPTDMIYKGIVSYDASEPIQLVALHGPLAEGEDSGQPIWTPDGETKFALT
ncbi:MAG: hypothetical protein ACE1YX_01020, partial [Nitrosopumilaceae archaeon]